MERELGEGEGERRGIEKKEKRDTLFYKPLDIQN